MKSLFLVLVCICCASFVQAQDQIIGKWLTEDKEAVIEIVKSGKKYQGQILWMKEGKLLKDDKNPDKTKRDRLLINLVILDNLVYKDGKWQGGSIYDPSEGKTYDCTVWLNNDNLKVRGYLGIFYQTETWTRMLKL